MNTQDTLSPAPAPVGRRSRRGPVLGAIAGFAALAAAALALPLVIGATGGDPTALRQPEDAGPAAMCAVLTPELLAQVDEAFRATVTGVEDGTVTLTVSDRFTGDVEDTVEIPQGDDSVVDGASLVFVDGKTYLIAAVDGTVASCGASGVDSPALAEIYDAAFD